MKAGFHSSIVEIIEQSKAVNAHTFTTQAEKNKQKLSARKLKTTAFWDRKGMLMVNLCNKGP
jgi:hypothetical protein